jgi:hypothetical protein
MAIPEIPRREAPMALNCKCGWTGTKEDLSEIEGYCCPKCGEPLFRPDWIDNPPSSDNS